MDWPDKVLHDPNMPKSGIPIYALYGDTPRRGLQEWLHCETIASRSALHGWEIRPHRHEAFFQILHITAGEATGVIENRPTVLPPPCALMLPAMTVHGFRFSADIQGTVITLIEQNLDILLGAEPAMRARLTEPSRIVFTSGDGAATETGALIDRVVAEYSQSEPGRTGAIQANLTLLLIRLAREAALAESDLGAPAGRGHKCRYLQSFRALVDRWYREHRPLDDYAGELGITTTQLNRICREFLDRSALGVVNARILLEAERALVYSQIGVNEIAYALGFADPAYFARFFTKHAGVTPGAYRTQARQALAASVGR